MKQDVPVIGPKGCLVQVAGVVLGGEAAGHTALVVHAAPVLQVAPASVRQDMSSEGCLTEY